MKKSKNTHGGRRAGAGRKAKYDDTVAISVTLSNSLREKLDKWAADKEMNRSEAIVSAIKLLIKK